MGWIAERNASLRAVRPVRAPADRYAVRHQPGRLPRMTTRRWMIAVAVVGSCLGGLLSLLRTVEDLRLATYHAREEERFRVAVAIRDRSRAEARELFRIPARTEVRWQRERAQLVATATYH